MKKICLAVIAFSACVSISALGQLSAQTAHAGNATTVRSKTLSPDVDAVLSPFADMKSAKIVLETDRNIEDKAVRMELVMTSDRRFVQRFWDIQTGDGAGPFSDENVAHFAFCDASFLKARRGTFDMYLRHDAHAGWQPAPGPTCVALAPWPVLKAVAQSVPGAPSVSTENGATLLTLGDTKHVLSIDSSGTISSWATSRESNAEVTEYVDAATSDGAYAMPGRIIQRYPARGETPPRTVEWRVLSVTFNPSDAEERLDFAPFAAKFQRFDPDTGDIINPDGSIAGREIQPAAMAVDAWDRHTRTKAWTSVFKWGSIATGMFVLAFVMELIRRRL